MNDPNGLCKIGGVYHLFYQFHPGAVEWGPMHWGHATSADLMRWKHLPVFLHPEQNLWRLGATGGAFSGSAIETQDDGIAFFYTERLAAYDLTSDYKEIQKRAVPDPNVIKPLFAENVIVGQPKGTKCAFRDPKVWFDGDSGSYRMVVGSSVDGDPAVLLYGTNREGDWGFIGILYRAPRRFRENGANCAECPDFFELGGRWILIMGFIGFTEPETGRQNLLYAVLGDFRDDIFVSASELQLLDFGGGTYAMQTIADNDRRLAFAWASNWTLAKPPGSSYAGEQSLPRELSVSEDGILRMLPAAEFLKTTSRNPVPSGEIDSFNPGGQPFEMIAKGRIESFRLSGRGRGRDLFQVQVVAGTVSLAVSEDDGRIEFSQYVGDIENMHIVFDRGIIEAFVNGGRICGTRRTYAGNNPDRIATEFAGEIEIEANLLRI